MEPLHSFAWYARQIAPSLPKKAFQPEPLRLIGGFIYIFLTMMSSYLIIQYPGNFFVNLLLSIVIGVCFSGMIFLTHEILHGTVVRKKRLQNILGMIFFWPLCVSPVFWIKWHNLSHHIHTQNSKKDPDIKFFFQGNRIWDTVPFILYGIYKLMAPLLGVSIYAHIVLINMFKDFPLKKRLVIILTTIIPWVSWLGLLLWIGPYNWIFVYLIPLFIANYIITLYLGTQHYLNPGTYVNDPLANTLTVTVPRWIDWLHFNFSYHTEHHVFPGMSSKYYPLVKKELKERWPHLYQEMSMVEALKIWFRTKNHEFTFTNLKNTYEIQENKQKYKGVKETFKNRK
ncbi:acyl-CoA desaturase [Bacillus carboniphilus]|uniref:Acyl-CoA desaturase n=1 Tax=Bacillus carboniphilus TaxID=86663 RepID=A0ABY9JTH1_9BACI|nr:acyl-CoA desaturase [Bacillus carboniphilus]WLR42684.1 acyl-CoA desaturase [Bacillus carboniphilus]